MDREIWKTLLMISDRAQQAGMLLGSAAVPRTFQETLMPRSTMDQAMVTGVTMTASYIIGAMVQDNVEDAAFYLSGADEDGGPDTERKWRRYALAMDLAAMGLGFAIQAGFWQRPEESLRRASIRTGGHWLSASTLAGLTVAAVQEAADYLGFHSILKYHWAVPASALLAALRNERRHYLDARSKWGDRRAVRPEVAMAFAVGVAAAVWGLSVLERTAAERLFRTVSRFLPADEMLLRPLGHVGVLLAVGGGIAILIWKVGDAIEEGAERLEPPFSRPPTSAAVSGSLSSLVPWQTLSKQGRRITSTYLRPEWIEDVMGEPALEQPIRVFVGEDSAPELEDRVDLAMRELERTDAFDRSLLMVISPTGTGFANFVAVEAAEYMSRGDMASVTLQYGKRPSVLSLDRVPEAVQLHRMFLEALQVRLGGLPHERRPRVVLFGESLGAWASQDAFADHGTDGLLALEIERALWIGTPHESRWKDQVLGSHRPDVDKTLVGAFNDFGQVEAMDPDSRAKLRYVMVTHYNDAVALFSPSLLVQKPEWLRDPERRPPTIPSSEKYSTPTTFIQTLVDMKNAGFETHGKFQANAHDYRADLARFIREVYAFDATEEQMARIEDALRQYDEARATWLEEQDSEKERPREEGSSPA